MVSLSTIPADATIRYTIDGTSPIESGTIYTSSFQVSSTSTIKAIAYKTGWATSQVASGTYTITGVVPKPVFSLEAGIYTENQIVTINCSLQGSLIRYTTDGTNPSSTVGTLYSGAISVSSSCTLKAIAYKSDWLDSDIASAIFTITGKVSAPTFSPITGTYTTAQSVTISCSLSGASIRYTTDGTNPSSTLGTLYSNAISVTTSMPIKAIAYKTDWIDSAISNADYTINAPTLIQIEMVNVAGGTFQMGSSDDVSAQPVHAVTLSTFEIGKYEITQSQYMALMGINPARFSAGSDAGNRPVENVTWYDAIEFCNMLSDNAGFSRVYSYSGINVTANMLNNGYRLPTEAEWEFAARGGIQSQGYTYAGSNVANIVAWSNENSGNTTHSVGAKAPNELGLYDMSGNISEFCWDTWGNYSSESQTNPMGAPSGNTRMLRGGAWSGVSNATNSTRRANADPMTVYDNIGFRVVRRPTVNYAIGDIGPAGGLVFYDKGSYSNGWRYLEATPYDQSIGIPWYNGNYINTWATAIGIGTGKANTATIISSQGAGDYAASLCDSLILGGFDDWFLPSKNELDLIYDNLRVAGLSEFASEWYWTSSELDRSNSWIQYFHDRYLFWSGGDQRDGIKYGPGGVRAVRAF
jgi:formylglycine-generating enzyme required for sulfatase activity